MSHVYVPTAVPVVNATLPDDGDLASAASVNDPFETALDGVKYAQDSIDGTSTGTMTPADISVGGGAFTADASTVSATANMSCAADLNVAGATVCGFSLRSNGPFHCVGAATFAATVAVTSSVSCASISIPGTFSAIGGDTTISGTSLTVNAPCTSSALDAMDVGGFRSSVIFQMTDASVSPFTPPANGEKVYVPAGVLSTDRLINFTNSSSYIGCTIRIFSSETTHKVTIQNGGVTLGEVRKSGGAGQYEWMDITWTVGGGGWTISGGQRL